MPRAILFVLLISMYNPSAFSQWYRTNGSGKPANSHEATVATQIGRMHNEATRISRFVDDDPAAEADWHRIKNSPELLEEKQLADRYYNLTANAMAERRRRYNMGDDVDITPPTRAEAARRMREYDAAGRPKVLSSKEKRNMAVQSYKPMSLKETIFAVRKTQFIMPREHTAPLKGHNLSLVQLKNTSWVPVVNDLDFLEIPYSEQKYARNIITLEPEEVGYTGAEYIADRPDIISYAQKVLPRILEVMPNAVNGSPLDEGALGAIFYRAVHGKRLKANELQFLKYFIETTPDIMARQTVVILIEIFKREVLHEEISNALNQALSGRRNRIEEFREYMIKNHGRDPAKYRALSREQLVSYYVSALSMKTLDSSLDRTFPMQTSFWSEIRGKLGKTKKLFPEIREAFSHPSKCDSQALET